MRIVMTGRPPEERKDEPGGGEPELSEASRAAREAFRETLEVHYEPDGSSYVTGDADAFAAFIQSFNIQFGKLAADSPKVQRLMRKIKEKQEARERALAGPSED